MRIAFFGSSLISAYWNGAATYYRGIIRALAARRHKVTFYEPAAFDRLQHRDIEDPEWCRIFVYPPAESGAARALADARRADMIVKASGVGVLDEFLEAAVLDLKSSANLIAFWDVDAPATLDRVRGNSSDPFRSLIARYDLILTYGGGAPVVEAYRDFGARVCVPIYNALDPETHHPADPDPRFEADLAFLGNRLPDRERRAGEFFFGPAETLAEFRFVLGGAGWADRPRSANVRWLDHVYTRDHNSFNCTPRAVLNISRESMAAYGYSPATRVFEAAGAAACILTDAWEGIEQFLEPDREILVVNNGDEVIEQMRRLSPARAREIGAAARRRVLAEHTYNHRARQLEAVIECGSHSWLPPAFSRRKFFKPPVTAPAESRRQAGLPASLRERNLL